ncbi:MAG: SDR family oxidoreductase [Elusimicrobia bacterium]|nr:SDR family oxidoreductase [Elusimicrobiota bacterium]
MYSKDLLKDKVAVVTGGGTGIGKVVALELARHGAHVVLAARQLDRLSDAAKEIEGLGRKALAVATDIASFDQVKALFERVDQEFGRVDLMVNNAAANFIRPSETLTSVRWRKVIDIVLHGTFHCTLEAGKRMLKQGGGSVINMVTAYAWRGAPGLLPSASAKAGVVALTRTLGVEWAARGVRVNAIAPGFIDTPQSRERLWPEEWIREELLSEVPGRKFGTELDVANAVLYLASPLASYVTGEVLVVDGGESLGKGALRVIEKAGAVRRAAKK